MNPNNELFIQLQQRANLDNKQCSKLLGIALRTVQSWKKGDREVPEMALNFLKLYIQNNQYKY